MTEFSEEETNALVCGRIDELDFQISFIDGHNVAKSVGYLDQQNMRDFIFPILQRFQHWAGGI